MHFQGASIEYIKCERHYFYIPKSTEAMLAGVEGSFSTTIETKIVKL